jgi:crotonobetainyl-CoA:carnitine CoA-transferase CaiB-like acyl-CoA transferase
MTKHLLSGIRVLDFGRYIAGPYCATLLGEYGADVIRIEKRTGGEDRYIAPIAASGEGGMFMQINRNKRSLTLDPLTPEGKEVVAKLVRSADIVVANLPEPALKQMGLDYETLKAIKPEIILVTSSAFGSSGPLAKNVGFDGVAQAMSGVVYMTGQPDEPYRAAVNWVDFGTALHCALGAMAALMARGQTGQGQVVTGSLLATAVSFNNGALIEQAVAAPNRVPTGNRGQTAAPVDIYKTQDGWILVQVVGKPLFERIAKLIGEPDWLVDPRFTDDELRGQHGELISARVAQWCEGRSLDQAFQQLGDAKIPCGPVLSPQQTLEHPQIQATQLLNPLPFPDMPSAAPITRGAFTLSETEKIPLQRAPLLGEHTDEILAQLGYKPEEIAALRAKEVV